MFEKLTLILITASGAIERKKKKSKGHPQTQNPMWGGQRRRLLSPSPSPPLLYLISSPLSIWKNKQTLMTHDRQI
jgi:hypothetical protein